MIKSVITTGLLSALTPVERWQALRNLHENHDFMLDRRFVILGVAAIAILTILLCWINYRQRRSTSKTVNETFNSFAQRSGLSAEEQKLVLFLAAKAGLKQPDTIFFSAAAFDSGAAELLAQESGDRKNRDEQNELESKLSLLRTKLGFEAQTTASTGVMVRGGHASSRQIPINKMLLITRRKNTAAARMEAKLIRSNELEFILELPDELKIEAGEVWNLQYNFGPSVWEFDARLLRVEGRELVFGHSEDVRFISRRRFLRVEVHKDAYIARFPFAAGSQLNVPQFVHGKLIELAGPGLLIEAPFKMNVGERVLTIIQVADDKVVEDLGMVRHTKPLEGGSVLAIELIGVTEANVDELVRLTNAAAAALRTREPVNVG